MGDWDEGTLRKAASWKAFKEGMALLEGGFVSDATATAAGWRGTVRSGKRPLRVSVTVRSATDLETRCPCPENQSSGALCCHAVAVGLAAMGGGASDSHGESAPPAAVVPPARDVALGPNWRDLLAHGRLTASISPSGRETGDPCDIRLHDFLVRAGLAGKSTFTMQVGKEHLSEFLPAIAGHPGVFAERGTRPLEVSMGHRFSVESMTRHGDEVRLSATDPADWLLLDGMAVRTGGDSIRIAGMEKIPPPLAGIMEKLAGGEDATVPLRSLLAHLESWQDWLEFPDHGWLADLHFVPAQAEFLLSLDGSLREVRAGLLVRYPGAEPVPPGAGSVGSLPCLRDAICEIRNSAAESDARQRLESAGFASENASEGRWKLQGESDVLQFLGRRLPHFQTRWTVQLSSGLERARSRIVFASPRIELVHEENDRIEFDLKYQTSDGGDVPIHEIRRLLRSGNRHGRLSGGQHLWLDDEALDVLDPLVGELDLRQEHGRYQAVKCAAEIILEIKNNLDKNQHKNGLCNFFEFQIPAGLKIDLRHYQSEGCAWLKDRLQRYGGALLADDMGLGKTIQTIAVIESLFQGRNTPDAPALVIASTSLLGNWRAEFARFAPSRGVRVLHGAGREELREGIRADEVAITSFGTLARDLAWYLRREFRVIAVDEASLMRNPDTDHARAIAKLRSPHRIALTGTPVENGVRDLWSIFRFIQPGWLGSLADFRERYESPLTGEPRPQGLIRRLRLKTSPFILRRTKEEVAPELPGKLGIDEFCDLSGAQQAVYRDLMTEGRRQVESLADSGLTGPARMRMLTTLLRLRQTCCDLALLENDRFNRLSLTERSAKIVRLMELLEQAASGNHRVLVFSQFRKQLLEIEKCVLDAGLGCLRLDGQSRNRQELVERFQDSAGPGVFLISLKAGGYGLNLTAADTVVHFDPWWNPAAEMQATDRAHRIGQTRPVTVYRLLTRGTVEEKVLRLQADKKELARAIDETGEDGPPAGLLDDPERLRSLFEM